MKNILSIPAILLIILISADSCKKSSPRTTALHSVTATMSGGGSFTSDTTFVSVNDYYSPTGHYYLMLWGRSTSGSTFGITFPQFSSTTGTWHLIDSVNFADTLAYAGYTPVSGSAVGSAHGAVVVTAVSPNLCGTFSFTGTDSVVYTGSFDVSGPPYP